MGTLWLVATPIGNLDDLAPRAVEVLAGAALVCCEDTRRTGRLLQHAGTRAARLAVCNEHSEASRIGDVLDVLGSGGDVAIVSDAGSPGISEPGERIVRAVIDAGYEVSAVPGPSAVIMALTTSGLPTQNPSDSRNHGVPGCSVHTGTLIRAARSIVRSSKSESR